MVIEVEEMCYGMVDGVVESIVVEGIVVGFLDKKVLVVFLV